MNSAGFAVICEVQIVARTVESARASERSELTTANGCSLLSIVSQMFCNFIETDLISWNTKSNFIKKNLKMNHDINKGEIYYYFSLRCLRAISSMAASLDCDMASGEWWL